MMTPEAKISAKIVRWAKAHGIEPVRMSFRPGVKQGFPDLLLLLPNGYALWVEVKRPSKVPTPLQHHRLKRLRALKHFAMWVDDAADLIETLERMMMWKERR